MSELLNEIEQYNIIEKYSYLFRRPTKLVHGADQTMAIVCSSGTSGLPKAVTITNSQLLLISP